MMDEWIEKKKTSYLRMKLLNLLLIDAGVLVHSALVAKLRKQELYIGKNNRRRIINNMMLTYTGCFSQE